jgi:hypothetical protein
MSSDFLPCMCGGRQFACAILTRRPHPRNDFGQDYGDSRKTGRVMSNEKAAIFAKGQLNSPHNVDNQLI